MGGRRTDLPDESVAGVWGEAPEPAEAEHPFGGAEADRYEPGGLLGLGGMGRVVSARDRRLDRVVARKEALPELGAAGAAQLVREARVMAGLEHPGIVAVHDAGVDAAGRPWYAMRLLGGRTLQDLLAGPDAEPSDALRPLLAAAQAVAFAHARGVVHRDLKPANILLGELGETQVADWGLARGLDEPPAGAAPVGTPRWMSPEQRRGEPVGPASDVFSLGLILAAAAQHDPSPELAAIVRKATEEHPADRYPDARAFAEDLARYLDGRRVRAHDYSGPELLGRLIGLWKAPLLVAAVAALLLAVAVGIGWTRTSRERELARTHLARALVQQARVAEAKGKRAEAEMLAASALRIEESAAARGVLVAFAGQPRPRRDPLPPLPCGRVRVAPDGFRVCIDGAELRAFAPGGDAPSWSRPVGEDVHAFLAGPRLFAAGGPQEGWVELDRASGEVLASHPFPTYPQQAVGDGDRTALWRATEFAVFRGGEAVLERSGCGDRVVLGVDLSGEGLRVLCGDGELLDLADDGVILRRSRPAPGHGLSGFVALPDGRPVLLGADGVLRVVPPGDEGTPIEVRAADHALVEGVLDPRGRRLALRTERGGVAVWELGAVAPVRLPVVGASDLAWTGDGRLLTVGDDADGAWRFPAPGDRRVLALGAGLAALAPHPSGGSVAAARGDGVVTVWDLGQGGARDFRLFPGVVKDVDWLPGGRSLLAVTATPPEGTGSVAVDLVDGRISPAGPAGAARRVGVFESGRVLTLGWGLQVGLSPDWATRQTGDPLPGGPFWDLALHRAGRTVALLGEGPALVVAEEQDGALRSLWSERVPGAGGVAVHPSGLVAVSTEDGVRLFDGGPPGRALTARVLRPLSPALSPGGDLVAVSDLSGAIWVWETASGRLLAELRGHEGRVSAVAFRDDRELLSAGWDGTVRRWDLGPLRAPPAELLRAAQGWGLTLEEVLAEPL